MHGGAILIGAAMVGLGLGTSAFAAPTVPKCLKVMTDMAADAPLAAAAFAPAPCTADRQRRAFHYDRGRRTVVLAHALAAGSIVSTYAGFAVDAIHAGENLKLVVAEGPVRVERDVKALQSARAGQSLFVQADDGTVWPVRYEDVAP